MPKDSKEGCVSVFEQTAKRQERMKNMAKVAHCVALIINVVLPTNRPLSVANAMKCVPKELQNAGISFSLSPTFAGSHVLGISGRRCPRKLQNDLELFIENYRVSAFIPPNYLW